MGQPLAPGAVPGTATPGTLPGTATPGTLPDSRVLRVGIIGTGTISAQYLAAIPGLEHVSLVAVADLHREHAERVAEAARASVPDLRVMGVEELLASPEIDAVLNLTIPRAHAAISEAAIAAGKHIYNEKPLTSTLAEAERLLSLAGAAGVRVGCAPDTVLGAGIQTARRAIDEGLIGSPIAATATMVTPGHERWHPNPDFYYQEGGGPLLDMGPYYVTALVTLLGPVASVIGAASRTRDRRTIGTGPRAGEEIPVSIDSHVTGVLVHEGGALSTLVMSFDAAATHAANIEVHGSAATLAVPDPNHFDGEVRVRRVGEPEWETLPVSAGYAGGARGIGLDEMAEALAEGREHRAGGALGLHVLETMEALLASARDGRRVDVRSRAARPAAVPLRGGPAAG